MELRPDQVQAVCRYAPARRVAQMLPHLNASLVEADVTTSARAAMYLAQLAHESSEFAHLVEIWGPTSAQLRYEPPSRKAEELGNAFAGDGFLFRGRGAIQLTGRSNYRRAGAELGLALEAHPELAALPEVAFRVAAWFWRTHGCNAPADRGDVEACTRIINGGLTGIDHRLEYFQRACEVLGG